MGIVATTLRVMTGWMRRHAVTKSISPASSSSARRCRGGGNAIEPCWGKACSRLDAMTQPACSQARSATAAVWKTAFRHPLEGCATAARTPKLQGTPWVCGPPGGRRDKPVVQPRRRRGRNHQVRARPSEAPEGGDEARCPNTRDPGIPIRASVRYTVSMPPTHSSSMSASCSARSTDDGHLWQAPVLVAPPGLRRGRAATGGSAAAFRRGCTTGYGLAPSGRPWSLGATGCERPNSRQTLVRADAWTRTSRCTDSSMRPPLREESCSVHAIRLGHPPTSFP